MSATASVSSDASHFWNNPLGFSTTRSTSTATMFDLLGKTKILCLVILPKKDSDGLYRGDKILKQGWEAILSRRDQNTVVGYTNKVLGYTTTSDPDCTNVGFPFNNEYPIMYGNPVVKYAFYAHTIDKSSGNDNMYALIGSNGTSKHDLRDVENTCLPFPTKMKSGSGEDLPYNPEQFPNRNGYLENRNPTLVEFSNFLNKNPTVGCFYVRYDDGPEMQERRSDKTKADAAAREDDAADRRYQNSLNGGPPVHQSELGQNGGYTQNGGGGPEYVVPTINASMFEGNHKPYIPPTSGHVLDRYILDQFGITAFTEKIKKFYDEVFGDEYKKKVKDSINAMVKQRLEKYVNAIPTAINLSKLPPWIIDKANKDGKISTQEVTGYINDYLNKYSKDNANPGLWTQFKGKVTGRDAKLESLIGIIEKQRTELITKSRLEYIRQKFEGNAKLLFPTTLSQVNTGLAGLMRNNEVIERNYTKLRTSFCCLFFDESFEDVLSGIIDVERFEIFRESNNPNGNLLKALYLVIAHIEANQANPAAPVEPVVSHNWNANFDSDDVTLPVASASPASDPGWVANFSTPTQQANVAQTTPLVTSDSLGPGPGRDADFPTNTQPVASPTSDTQPVASARQPGLFWVQHAANALDDLHAKGGNIKKPYSKKNRKRYSKKNRKRYSRKNRKRYSGKNRKRYSGKNKKRYSRKNRKSYIKKNI